MKKILNLKKIEQIYQIKKRISSKNVDSGRSMVEMLGVLAVIGVLSIAGITGYTFAMEKYRSNQLLRDLSLRAASVSTQMLADHEGSLEEFENGTEFNITLGIFEPDSVNYFTLDTENVPLTVCSSLILNPPKGVIGIYLDNVMVNSPSACVETNNMVFAFHKTLESTNVNAVENGNMDCLLTCPGGETTNANCGANEKKVKTDNSVCGKSCYVCRNDSCPSGTSKSCDSGYTATFESSTEAGSSCYRCVRESVLPGSGGIGGGVVSPEEPNIPTPPIDGLIPTPDPMSPQN